MDAAAIQLGMCSRLRARISVAQCHKNRHGVPANPRDGKRAVAACYACDGCPGLEDLQLSDYQPPVELEKPEVVPLIHGHLQARPTKTPRIQANEEDTQINVESTAINVQKETIMAKKITPRGTCPTCHRDDVLMPGPKCARCYYRTAHGQDPVTGKPVAAQEAGTPPAAATPPILPETPVQAAPNAHKEQPQPDPDKLTITLHFIGPDLAVWHALQAESLCKRRTVHDQAIYAISSHLLRKGKLRVEVE